MDAASRIIATIIDTSEATDPREARGSRSAYRTRAARKAGWIGSATNPQRDPQPTDPASHLWLREARVSVSPALARGNFCSDD